MTIGPGEPLRLRTSLKEGVDHDDDQRMTRLASVVKHHAITVVMLLWAGYVASFPTGHASILGDMYVAVSVFPTVVTAHLLGMRGARVVAVAFYPLHALLFFGSHHEVGLDLLGGPEGALGMLVLPLIALYAGYTSDLRRKLVETDEAKDRFIAAVAHDVKNPLTGVLGLAIALRDEPGLPADARELAAMVADEAQSAADIVEDLSVTALRNSGGFQTHPEPFDLGEEAWAACRSVADVSFEAEGDVEVFADPRRVRQILNNLLTNALRHGQAPVDVYVGSDRRWATVEVTDHGDGIPSHAVDALFEPFGLVGVSGHVDSTGLGLSSARVLATLMGGDLTYLRSSDATTFRLTLPIARSPAPGMMTTSEASG